MSGRAEDLAAEYAAAVLGALPAVQKSAGTAELVYATALPLCRVITERDKHIARMSRATRKRTKEIKQVRRTLDAIAGGQPVPRGMVPYQPAAWETRLVPKREPAQVNGYDKEQANGQG